MKFQIILVNKHVKFLMTNLKATSSWSRLHVGLVVLCCYETPWRWHLCAETCSSWHFTWSVFCDSCSVVYCWAHFVGWYSECKEIHNMNNEILVSNCPCDPPPPPEFCGSQADNNCAISHMCNTALHTGYCASCSGSKLRAQQYRCDQKVRLMLLPSAIQRKGNELQYGKRRVEPW